MVINVLGSPHIIFNQNKHVKISKTYKDIEAHSNANLPNVIDVLECLTSKHYETSYIDY